MRFIHPTDTTGKLEYRVKVVLLREINMKGETKTSYRLVTRKVRLFNHFFVIILLILILQLLKTSNLKLEHCEKLQY